VTASERGIVLRLLEREPAELLALLAGNLAPVLAAIPKPAPEPMPERRPGDDPYLIDEDEFSYRARSMSYDEQKVLRARVNAARAHQKGRLDDARRYRKRADLLERRLNTGRV